jgi:hypothetical protein
MTDSIKDSAQAGRPERANDDVLGRDRHMSTRTEETA